MSNRKQVKLVHEGEFVAEVEVELIDSDTGWGPYLTLEDAGKLDAVRIALRNKNVAAALKLADVFRLTPVTAI